ncbi:helix-turn-helix domain-containing protein [Cloacibacillus evryensis]
METIGSQLKTIRKKKGLTLSELAEASDVSLSFLSKIERDINTPTIAVLQKLCNALNISINDLISNVHPSPCVKKENRKPIYENSDSLYEQATPPNEFLKGDILTIFPNSEIKTYEHVFDEVGLILEGNINVILDGTEYRLSEGDTVYVRKGTNHIIKNTSNTEKCVTYWVKAILPAI